MSSRDAARQDELRASGTGAPPTGEEIGSDGLVGEIVRYASDKKASDLIALDMRGVVGYTDWLIVCSGNTERQTKAIHDGILEGCKREHGLLPRRVEGLSRGDWILMDYLDVVAHIFTPATREYYRLEQLWGEAPVMAVGESSVG